MAGTIIPLWSARTFDYSGLAQGSETTVALRLITDLLRYRAALLLLRVHEVDITGLAELDFAMSPAAPSREDPAASFVDTTTEARLSVAGTVAGTLLRADVTLENYGAAVQLVVNASQPSGVTETISARVSAALLAYR